MKLVLLDSYAMREGDLDWSQLRALVDGFTAWPRTPYEEAAARIGDADFVVVNKTWIDDAVLDACPNVKWIGLTATGTDSLDLDACRRHGVPVSNVPGYSTHSVAQHVFSLLLSICQCPDRYYRAVKGGCWQTDIRPEYGVTPQRELFGKTLGIVGYGDIGRSVARIAQGFGMNVIAHTRTVRDAYLGDGVKFMPLDELLAAADVVTLHCPATPKTRGMICDETLAAMKPGAILTPHIAWATRESLDRLAAIVTDNFRSYLAGQPKNLVT